ncbi:hypothetical protein Ctob_009687 [Chrysochromulina tobinii]|uniref:Uncharacterized protein n=1 Tax=Chrysochromulina tobinii TaxID=1460289 RepID=A0A0M0K7R9_9EUKA|nr:hypothetical protein Ctob_009687 [Chrysochromulina tobinii]|eukprot:KOO34849.1 hypothetical protein Ctob_009687 [Chrysochromulina sp. CCMP291]
MVHESRADALEQLQASQARAREQEREQMHELMHELRSWKRQNERRMAELTMRTSATLTPLGETRVPDRFGQLGGGACERGAAHGGAVNGGGEGNGRSLRELQRELESLKSSLSVYLGSGLA